jgi:5-methylcytosine-specific restriction endonuclease McrA
VCRGIEGIIMRVEPPRKYIPMTKDHIVPKIDVRSETLADFKTMCQPCNSKKGDPTDLPLKVQP